MRTVLLDTHVVLWWLGNDVGGDHPAIGKLDIDLADPASFPAACRAQGFRLVPVEHQDAWSVRDLPPARTDPFDRLITATTRRRRWTVVTADRAFDDLDVDVVRP